MTRRDFRGSVSTPRPAAAWIMSIVASATIWLTDQLPWWLILIQCLALGMSYATRINPPAFSRSPIWLNVLMAGITTITIRSALSGNPATISLAYFTSLAQGLQLLDARPRKSEFVLVALALFQVILASNLTDSVFFPPLVVLFLASVTWTLLLHTLSSEAAEAGDPGAATRVVASDLRRMTIAATAASLVLAAALFVMLPRVRTNFLQGGIGKGISLSGFSERVALGEVGRIRMDHSIVMRVEGLDGELPKPAEAYWRGLAFDHFDGTNWAISVSERVPARRIVHGVGRFGIELSSPDSLEPPRGTPDVAQRILREPVAAGVLFTPGQVERIEGPFQNLERDRNGGLYLAGRGDERVRYTIWGRSSERDALRLRADRATLPLEPGPGGPRPTDRYLQLPELDPRVAELATRIASDQSTDFDRALAIRDYLRREGDYTDSPPALGSGVTSPIEDFILGELQGHCEYFASAMVVLARSQGLPSRLINGFAGGVPNEVGDFLEVSRADAHAWVEVHFERSGWVRFDPTPPDLRLRSGDSQSLWTRVGQFGSALELWWFQRVVDFDSADQISALRGLWRSWNHAGEASTAKNADTKETFGQTWQSRFAGIDPVALFLAFVVGMVGIGLWRRPNRGAERDVPASYRAAQKILARAGWRRDPSTSALDFAARVTDVLPDTGAQAFRTITYHYLAERFGERAAIDLRAELEALEHAVDRMRLRNQSHIS